MAQLKDTTISGSLRVTDNIYSITNQFKILQVPTTSNDTTYGPGSSGQTLVSNGTSIYWGNISNLTGTLGVAHGGTGATTIAQAKSNLGLGNSTHDFSVLNYTGLNQNWGIRAVVPDGHNYSGRQNALILLDTGISAYSSKPGATSISNDMWALYATAEGQIRFHAYTAPTDVDTNSATELLFVKFAHAPYNVGTIGSSTQPIYMTQTGELAACNFKIIYNASTPTGTISEGTIWLQPIS